MIQTYFKSRKTLKHCSIAKVQGHEEINGVIYWFRCSRLDCMNITMRNHLELEIFEKGLRNI